MKNLKPVILLTLFILTIVSCTLYNPSGIYRGKRNSTFFEKNYLPIDSISINRIKICKQQNRNIGERFKTKGRLNISVKDIENELVAKLKKNFNHVNYELKNDTTGNFDCNFLTRKNILSGTYDRFLNRTNDYIAEITFNMAYTSSRETFKDGFYGGQTEILDNDLHSINNTLTIAILKENKLIYMNNYIYQKAIYSKHDEDVNYKISKGIIDTLITKSLAEYHKRVK